MKITVTAFFICTIMLFTAAPVMAQSPETMTTPASHAVLVDAQSGAILFEKNASEKMPTSSMSKTMTMYMVFDALKTGRIKLDDTMEVSKKAWEMEGSKMFIHVGDKVKVEDLIRGVIVQSGNDATIALAEGLAGSESGFVETMNARAKEIGLNDSNFMNASGWPDPNHYSTAKDLAVLAYRLINDYPEFYHYYSEKEFTYNKIKQANRNPLLYKNIGADGIKTGHTETAGYGLMGTAVQNGRRLILVVNGLANEKERGDEAERILDWGFKNFETVRIFKKGDEVEIADVWMGEQPTIPLVIDQDIDVMMYRPDRTKLKVQVKYETPIQAPVKKGQAIAKVLVTPPGMPVREYDLVAGVDVEKMGFASRAIAQAKYILLGHSD